VNRTDRTATPRGRTVSSAIDAFITHETVAGKKDIRDLVSTLRGPTEVRGRIAAGSALANSQYGALASRRLEAEHITDWFGQRFPLDLAPATRKRGMSHTRCFLRFGVQRGFFDEQVLDACMSLPDSPPRSEWLVPEQVVALAELADNSPFDDYERFALELLRDTGARPIETVALKPASLDPRKRELTVLGKGRGAGKKRAIPVDDDFIERWRSHVERFALRPNGWMLFSRQSRFIGGSNSEREWIIDKSRHTSKKTIQRICRQLSDLAQTQLPLELAPTFEITPKVFRRTYACNQLILHSLGLGGLDLVSLQAAMGHERLDTTRTYLSDVHSYLSALQDKTNTRRAAQAIVEFRANLLDNDA